MSKTGKRKDNKGYRETKKHKEIEKQIYENSQEACLNLDKNVIASSGTGDYNDPYFITEKVSDKNED